MYKGWFCQSFLNKLWFVLCLFIVDFRKCLIALVMTSVSGTKWFASFHQSNEKTLLMSSVSEHKYFELNLLDSRLISEVNLSIDIFPQRCSRILIKLWVVYQLSKSIVLEILLSSFLYYCPIQKTCKCMLWSKLRLKMFKANLWIWVLLLPHFIFIELKNCLYTKKYIFFQTS